jgi:hypothetical protein
MVHRGHRLRVRRSSARQTRRLQCAASRIHLQTVFAFCRFGYRSTTSKRSCVLAMSHPLSLVLAARAAGRVAAVAVLAARAARAAGRASAVAAHAAHAAHTALAALAAHAALAVLLDKASSAHLQQASRTLRSRQRRQPSLLDGNPCPSWLERRRPSIYHPRWPHSHRRQCTLPRRPRDRSSLFQLVRKSQWCRPQPNH